MSVAMNLLVVAFILASMDTVMSAIVRRDVSSKAQCAAYSYCEGKSFGGRVRVDGRYVTCDTVPEPRKRCCLPNSQHLVCYDIKVDGKLLNYDPSSFSRTTIAYNLCTALLKAHNHTDQGAHIGMLAGDGGGYLTYGHQGWTDLQTPSSRHVHDIACSYGQPATRRTKARHDHQHGRA